MTTIVAVKYPDKVVIGADSKVTDGSGRWWSHPEAKKMRQVGDYIIAGSGEVAALDIGLHIWQPPKPNPADRKDLYHFIVSKVVPSLRKCMKENDYDYKPKDGDGDDMKFNFLLVLDGQVFEFGDDFGVVMRQSGIYGIGSGSDIAVGALVTGCSVLRALEIAEAADIYTAAPFQILEQHCPKRK